MRGKGKTGRTVLTATAVAAAAAVACLAAFAFLPSGTEARYSREDVYAGQEIGMDEDERLAADPCVHSHNDPDDDEWIDLNEFVGDATSYTLYKSRTGKSVNGKYYLSGDLACRLTIQAGYNEDTEIDLCLNGHVLRNPSDSGTCLSVTRGSYSHSVRVNLYDCGGDMERHCYRIVESGYDTRYYDFSDGGIDPDDPGTYDGFVRGGLITGGVGGNSVGSPGGVQIADNSGNTSSAVDVTLNMYGGTIAGNHTSGMGGGVCVNSGNFNMYGGCIEGNAQTGTGSSSIERVGGGGVEVMGAGTESIKGGAVFRMYGGTIRDNCSAMWGGGVQVTGTSYSAVFEMYGGTIEGNRAQYGGGVGMYETGSSGTDLFRMYGGTIRDNASEYEGAGVYMRTAYSVMEMSGGTITGNVQEGYEVTGGTSYSPVYSDNCGGGIYFYNDDSITLSGTAYVYGNLCAGKRCNIGLKEGHCLTLGEFEEGAKVGVTLIDGQEELTGALDPSEEDALSSCLRYIVSDDTSYKVAVNGEGTQLVLQKKKES